MNVARKLFVLLTALALVGLFAAPTFAYSGFPTKNYPGNQYGFQSTYYSGPWGERMVYGGYGYFPNWYGYSPYGYRTYGSFYTPHDLRTGNMGYAYNSYGYRNW